MKAIKVIDWWGSQKTVDPDVTSYKELVVSSGGTLSDSEVSMLNTFASTMKQNGTWSGFEFYPFLGGFAGCLQKLKPINPSFTALSNNGPFISGDYVDSVGIYNNGSKWLGTGIVPDSNGMAHNNFSAGVWTADQINASAHYVIASRPASGGMPIYVGKTAIGLKGGTLQKLVPAPGPSVPCFIGVSLSSTESVFRFHYADLLPPSPNASVPPSQTLPDEITLFQARSFGSLINATARVSFGFIGPSMTRTQMDVMTTAIETLLISKGRYSLSGEAVFIGDSYTYGSNSSAYNTRYSFLTATALSLRERNMGIGGALLRSSASQLYGEYDRRYQILKNNYQNPNTRIFLASGLNDARGDTGATGTPATIADAKTKLKAEINELLAAGVATNRIVVCGIPYVNDGTPSGRLQAWNTMKQESASETGVLFVDWYTPVFTNWATWKHADNIHLIDVGHTGLKDAIISSI